MIKISQLLLKAEEIKGKSDTGIIDLLREKVIKYTGIKASDIKSISIYKCSVDARKKPEVYYSYTICADIKNEAYFLKHSKSNRISRYEITEFGVTASKKPSRFRPVVCGFGPAGIACAYLLAKCGYNPIIIERGGDVDSRTRAVESFWQGKGLDRCCNVQFGEGGAGAFSDGKLNTGNKDKDGLQRGILKVLVEFGAPEHILYMSKPHLGTDILTRIVKNIREYIKECGGEFLFNTTLSSLVTEQKDCDTKLKAIVITEPNGSIRTIETDTLILAIGHSARDTFRMLYDSGIMMESKSFAIGYRVAHPASVINLSQYGVGYEEKALPTADYKLTYHTKSDRAVYSFCMCPGGYIVDASSEDGMLAVNGMSYSKRNGLYSNSAIVMGIDRQELKDVLISEGCDVNTSPEALYGIALQEMLEKRAYHFGDGKVPVCSLGSFMGKDVFIDTDLVREFAFKGSIKSVKSFNGDNRILPKGFDEDFCEAMSAFGKRIKGFDDSSTIIAGVESRTSSPVRIIRSIDGQSVNLKGIYPIGEGAGYAGGIMSAAMDGARLVKKLVE